LGPGVTSLQPPGLGVNYITVYDVGVRLGDLNRTVQLENERINMKGALIP
jgi:hypothetical protein